MMHGGGGLVYSNGVDHAVTCVLGLLISLYALYVEVKKKADPKYVAACDLSDRMNCSKVLTSEYSQGFGLTRYLFGKDHYLNIPNCIFGLFFFSVQLILSAVTAGWVPPLLFYSSGLACLGCLYLSWVLFYVLGDLCIVCLATYVINFVLFYLNYQWYTQMTS